MKAILVAGLAYGDEGKGATVDFLCRRLPVDVVVRYNGGSQAAHNVVTPEGVHHTFSQFGSGTLAGDHVRTHLSRFMLVNPLNMMNEAEALHVIGARPWRSTTVDPRCVIVTPFHRRLNRLREQARGNARHGSCGQGIGVARELELKYGNEVLLAMDLTESTDFILHMLLNMAGFMRNEIEALEGKQMSWSELRVECKELALNYREWPVTLLKDEHLQTQLAVFEGAQGVLLDEKHGIEPHRTWTNCTFENADTLCNELGIETQERYRIGCLRTYYTRHGAGVLKDGMSFGPIPKEPHNTANEWQGAWRVAPFDYDLARQAAELVGGVDSLALSHLDCVANGCQAEAAREIGERVAPVGITSHGPTSDNREFTPDWTSSWASKLGAKVVA